MDEATRRLRELARRVVDAALELGPLRGALLTGSAARGDADFYSDLDLLLYVDELPPQERLTELQEALEGTNPVRFGDRTPTFDALQFDIDGVATQVCYVTVEGAEERLAALLAGDEEVFGPSQKILMGVREGVALHGRELIERWQADVRAYPDALRRAMVSQHWRFFPLWYHADALPARDAELWRLDMLLEAAFNLLAVLAGVNRVYFARFQLKRLRKLAGQMQIAPRDLADRLEELFRLPPDEAAAALGRLVLEVQAIVRSELPDVDVALTHPPGTRQQPWT
jgi:predicted nucleotidyltransferase